MMSHNAQTRGITRHAAAVCLTACLALPHAARADSAQHEIVHNAALLFAPGGAAVQSVNVPAFEDDAGSRILRHVAIEIAQSAGSIASVDNDSAGAVQARARLFRDWAVRCPGTPETGASTFIGSAWLTLAADNGDADTFDASPPDGAQFEALAYGPTPALTLEPALDPYKDPAGVRIEAEALFFIDDVIILPPTLEVQTQVEDATLRLDITVRYTFTEAQPCLADWLGDGTADSGDFFAFLEDFWSGRADPDADGRTTSADFYLFIQDFLGGC